MTEHIKMERMNDLVDGLVPEMEDGMLREHLGACAACRQEFEALSETVTAIRDLPTDAKAPEGLWGGIEARMAGPRVADTQVVPFPAVGRMPRRFALNIPQLAAAAAVVSLLSAGTMWLALSESRVASQGDTPLATSVRQGPSARVVATGETGYEEAVLQLQAMVKEGEGVLAPETLATLTASLRTIDDAIAEVRGALESDPSSELLARLLANHQRSKLRMLRQAAISVQPRS